MRPVRARPASKADETPEFKELWDTIWPAVKSPHDARALARDAFFRHIWWKEADPKDIVDAARFYVRSTGKAGECRLLLSNWLDRGFYEDMASLERAYQLRFNANNSNVANQSARDAYLAAERRRSERSFR